MQCPKCKAEVSDDNIYCGACGKKLSKKKPKKALMIIICIVGGIAILGEAAFIVKTARPDIDILTFFNSSTYEEKLAAKAMDKFKEGLRNPESLQIHALKSWKGGGKTFINADLSAQNGFGGMERKVYTFDEDLFYSEEPTGTTGTDVDIEHVEKLMKK